MNTSYDRTLEMARSYLGSQGLDCPADSCRGIFDSLNETPVHLVPWYVVPAANRLLSIYERSPNPRYDFTLAWRQPVNALWVAMHTGEPLAPAFPKLLDSLYYSTQFYHFDGQDGPQDANHDPAAACIYAIECSIAPDRKYIDLLFNRSIEYSMYDITVNDSTFGQELDQPVSQEFLELIHPSYRDAVQWHTAFLECCRMNSGKLPQDHELWVTPI